MDNYNSGLLISEAQNVAYGMAKSNNQFVRNYARQVQKAVDDLDVGTILRIKKTFDEDPRVQDLWDSYWIEG